MAFNRTVYRNTFKYLDKFSIRYYNSNAESKMQTIQTNNMFKQLKLLNNIKSYLIKLTGNEIIEKAVKKEVTNIIEKIQPKIERNHENLKIFYKNIGVYFESFAAALQYSTKTIMKKTEDHSSVYNTLNNKIDNNRKIKNADVTIPSWKCMKNFASKELIVPKVDEILGIIAKSNPDLIYSKIIELNEYIKRNPEAKHITVKKNGISTLLKIKQKTDNHKLQGALNELLTVLGYVEPVKGKGIRILSIDGGGVRGIIVIEMLKKLEEFTGKPIYEMFDLICGVSTGAIIATLIGIKRYPLDLVAKNYKQISTEIFTQSPLKGTSNLVLTHAYYDTELWEKVLKEQMGEQSLISTSGNKNCPKLCALSAVVNHSKLSAYLFRNYALPCRIQSQYMGDCNHLIWEAVRASAAAPTYFEEFKLGNMLHQDGGILCNNPTSVAIHEAKLLWPETPIQCVVSFGTGRTISTPLECTNETTNSSWKNKFLAIIESATDTEGVHTTLSDLLPENIYFRFNPYLTEMLDIAEINPEKVRLLEMDAVMYLRRNEEKFLEAAKTLNCTKNLLDKSIDWLYLQKEINGLNFKI